MKRESLRLREMPFQSALAGAPGSRRSRNKAPVSQSRWLGIPLGALTAGLTLLSVGACSPDAPVRAAPDVDREWPYYGSDEGGQRFSAARQVTPANVKSLEVVWRFSTGDMTSRAADLKRAAFEDTPLMVAGRLYVVSPFNEVFALNPANGQRLWGFDPKVDTRVHYGEGFTARGLAYWRDPMAVPGRICGERLFLTTNDRRLIALDAGTGALCPTFGQNGSLDVAKGVTLNRPNEMQITSPPAVANGVVVVGSAIADNQRLKEVSGAVRAFDAETGKPLWQFDPLASASPPITAGAANVWAPMSTDSKRGLVFLPTTSPSPDFWGGMRKGDDGDSDSVVALDLKTGRRVWAFKTVHHDVWDYDNPAQPTLATISWGGALQAAVLQPTKQGLLFTLNRDTGKPVIPVEERPVPQGGAPGEVLSPTQPFPTAPEPLAPSVIRAEDGFGIFPWDKQECRKEIEKARHDGLFTPPSTQGTIIYPFTGGGSNWGGLAFDPARGVAFVNTSSAMHLVTLIPAARYAAARKAEPNVEISPNEGAPFAMRRVIMKSGMGLPCNPPPWGLLNAIDMHTGKVIWKVPLGTTRDLAPGSQLIMHGTGVPNFGGPMATASGLVFIGATLDNYLRAIDAGSGRELWRGRLPAGGQATPMTYVWKGRQYVVIASGGHGKTGTKRGDQVVAFALPG